MNSGADIHTGAADDVSGWLLLGIDDTWVGIRQSEAASVLVASAVLQEIEGESSGFTEFNNSNWPVFDVNKQMIPVWQVSETRKFCVLLKDHEGFVGIMCDKTSILPQEEDLKTHPMPISLGQEVSPFKAIALHNDDLVCISQASTLSKYLKIVFELMTKKRAESGTN